MSVPSVTELSGNSFQRWMDFDVSPKMTLVSRLLIFAVSSGLMSCINKKPPPLRTSELGQISLGKDKIEFSFRAPIRELKRDYWDYRLGLVLPRETSMNLSGEVKILTLPDGDLVKSFHFTPTSTTESTWLGEDARVSHLLNGDLGLTDGEAYRVQVLFGRPFSTEGSLVLHFLSRSNVDTQIIEPANKGELVTPSRAEGF